MGKIQRYLLYLLPWWILVTLFSTALYLTRSEADRARQELTYAERIESAVNLLDDGIARLRRDTRLASQMAESYLAANNLASLAEFFRNFLIAHPGYLQARLLDDSCREILRLDRGPNGPRRTPEEALQDKSGRYYCSEVLKLDAENIYMSPMDLNVEDGKVVEPHEPTLRAAKRVLLPDGTPRGIIVLNLDSRPILDAFKRSGSTNLTLLNSEGGWLVSPDPADEFTFALGAPEHSFSRKHPDVWEAIRNAPDDGGLTSKHSGTWVYRQINAPDATDGNVFPTWYALAQLDPAQTPQGGSYEKYMHYFVTAAVLLALTIISTLFARSNTRRVELADALAATNAELKASLDQLHESLDERVKSEKLASLGLLVAGVAHELNTPVGAAMLTCSRLQEQMTTLQTAYEAGLKESDLTQHLAAGAEGVRLLHSNLQRTARLITQFKAVAAERSQAERSNFNLRDTVDEILELMHGEIKRRRIAIEVNIPPNIELDSYPGPLGQIVQNLVHNALRHGFELADSGHIVISANTNGDQIHLTVSDDGRGITTKDKARIWDPFFTTQRHRGGTGLGLHLCQQMATAVLGGTLRLLDTDTGHGAHFCLTLPVVAPDRLQPAAG